MATHSPESYCGLYDRVAQAKCRPQRIIWCGLPRGANVSCSYTPQTQQYRPSPRLSPSLFLIVELNGIKSFPFGIPFSALTLLNNLRGILTCYYPLTQRCIGSGRVVRYLAGAPDSEMEGRKRPALSCVKRWRGRLGAAGVAGPNLGPVHCNLPDTAWIPFIPGDLK